jgi:hypothetical protein
LLRTRCGVANHDRDSAAASVSHHPRRYAYFHAGTLAALPLDVQFSNVIARAWLAHTFVIGVLALTCIALCLNQWPVQEAPRSAPPMLTSAVLVIYAVTTTLLLPRRWWLVLGIHVAGLLALAAVL